MNDSKLLSVSELPEGFTYPQQYLHVIELGLLNLEPWYILQGTILRETHKGLLERYPGRNLVPFARRQDNDDIACWEPQKPETIFVIHDFASPGWEQSATYPTFYAWLRQAVEDLIEFDS